MRRVVTVLFVGAAVVVSGAGASAAQRVAGAADDRALARSLVLRRSDLGSGWVAQPAGASAAPGKAEQGAVGPCRGALTGRYRANYGVLLLERSAGIFVVSAADVYAGPGDARRADANSQAFFRCMRANAVGTTVERGAGSSRETVTYKQISLPRFPRRAASSVIVFDVTLAVNRAGQRSTAYQQWIQMRYGRTILRALVSIPGEGASRSLRRAFAARLMQTLDRRAKKANTN